MLGGLNSDIGLSFRGAGQREIQNSLSLDGINASSNLLAATSMRPIADAVTEVQVQTGSTSAEYGAYLGVHINVVTKSGTNTLHGAVFEFLQDDVARRARLLREPGAARRIRANSKQFGAQLDGPVVIPGLYDGRNKTFFMVAYEGVRGEAITSPFASVPTALMRQGNFSEITHTHQRTRSRGSRSRATSFPQSMLVADVARAAPVLPGANRAGHGQQPPGAERRISDNVDQFLGRVDQNLGNKVRLNLRYNWHDSYATQPSERGDPGHGGHAAPRQQELARSATPTRCSRTCSTTSGSATTGSTSTP